MKQWQLCMAQSVLCHCKSLTESNLGVKNRVLVSQKSCHRVNTFLIVFFFLMYLLYDDNDKCLFLQDISALVSLFLFQRRNGEDIPVAQTKNINHRRFAATFKLQEVTKTDQDLYRCVTQSERGSGVSNFAQLIVRGKVWVILSA